jgi:electron-transferring-flavoprotein dehydrogenase
LDGQSSTRKAKEVPNVTIDLFTGFAAHSVAFENGRVAGVAVTEEPKSEEDYVYGKFTCFGDKGFISRDVVDHFKLRDNPQIWSVGVKEVWQLNESVEGKVWHTLGYPLLDGTFGGGFVYGMKDNKLTIGMVISLDSQDPNMNPQQKLQDYKKHPFIQKMIAGGKLLKYGAALLPEGGYYSLPKKFYVPGALLMGDALGTLDVKYLAGVDRAMECGYVAAKVLHDALVKDDTSEAALAPYQKELEDGFVIKESTKTATSVGPLSRIQNYWAATCLISLRASINQMPGLVCSRSVSKTRLALPKTASDRFR